MSLPFTRPRTATLTKVKKENKYNYSKTFNCNSAKTIEDETFFNIKNSIQWVTAAGGAKCKTHKLIRLRHKKANKIAN